jgi:iron complex transport system substrate-binding protein
MTGSGKLADTMYGRQYSLGTGALIWLVIEVLIIVLDNPCMSLAQEMRQATDQLGRLVVFPSEPVRVMALAPSITEIVYSLGREDRLAGVTLYSDYPPPAQDLIKVGSYVQLDLERIVALKPDLCIAVKDGNPKETVDRLLNLNIPVFAVNPVDLASIMVSIGQLGMLLNAEKAAEAVVVNMQRRIKQVNDRVATSRNCPGVFFQIGISPIVSAGSGTFINELIVRAGGRNIAQGQTSYPRFSKEQVLLLDPDIIIITSIARAEVLKSIKRDWESWPRISAVKRDQIHVVNSDIFDRPTPRLVDGLELLASLIHPELFGY